ncbi:MAG TPA: hypothetical protein IGS17_18265, partial [Oscillatoriales cyanobacterium M59_W2019_021]|nr:hypothetical protein [Oscillatoriales cyanobacterium M59_W2019_021]
EILRESLRQCRLSFNFALGSIALSTVLAFSLLFSPKGMEAKIMMAVQTIASLGSVKFAKDNQEECDRIVSLLLPQSSEVNHNA